MGFIADEFQIRVGDLSALSGSPSKCKILGPNIAAPDLGAQQLEHYPGIFGQISAAADELVDRRQSGHYEYLRTREVAQMNLAKRDFSDRWPESEESKQSRIWEAIVAAAAQG